MIDRNNNYKNGASLRAEDCIGKIVVLGHETAHPNDEHYQRPLLFYVEGVDMDWVHGVCGESRWELCLSGRFLEECDCTNRLKSSSVPLDRVARLATFEEVHDFVDGYFDDWACLTPEIVNSIIRLAGTAAEEGSEPEDYDPDPWTRRMRLVRKPLRVRRSLRRTRARRLDRPPSPGFRQAESKVEGQAEARVMPRAGPIIGRLGASVDAGPCAPTSDML